MMFQSYALFPHLTVFENVAYGLQVLKRPTVEIKQSVHEVLDLVGMPGMETRSPSALSGGAAAARVHSREVPWCLHPIGAPFR